MPAPILVIHGALGSAAQMQPVADALRTLGPTHVVELPGHGDTPLDVDAFSMTRFADALASRVRAVRGADRDAGAPVAFGYSMGGYAALLLEAREPGTFGRIVTLGTKFDWTPASAAAAAARLDPDVVEAKVPAFAQALAARHEGAGGWRLQMTRTAGMLRAMGDAPPLTPAALANVRAPVLVAIGTKDDTLTAEESQAAVAAMPDARFMALEGIPHPIERVPVERIVELVRG